jgi:hypothetical protein
MLNPFFLVVISPIWSPVSLKSPQKNHRLSTAVCCCRKVRKPVPPAPLLQWRWMAPDDPDGERGMVSYVRFARYLHEWIDLRSVTGLFNYTLMIISSVFFGSNPCINGRTRLLSTEPSVGWWLKVSYYHTRQYPLFCTPKYKSPGTIFNI